VANNRARRRYVYVPCDWLQVQLRCRIQYSNNDVTSGVVAQGYDEAVICPLGQSSFEYGPRFGYMRRGIQALSYFLLSAEGGSDRSRNLFESKKNDTIVSSAIFAFCPLRH
jgi:hypothetical protein